MLQQQTFPRLPATRQQLRRPANGCWAAGSVDGRGVSVGERPSIVLCCRTWRRRWATSRQRCPAGCRRWTNTSRPQRTTGSAGRRLSRSTCTTANRRSSRARGSEHYPRYPFAGPWQRRTAPVASRPASTYCRPRTTDPGRPISQSRWKGQSSSRLLFWGCNKEGMNLTR